MQNLKESNEAVSPVIGVILMVAITVVLAAVVFVLVSDVGKDVDTTPDYGRVSFIQDDDESYLVSEVRKETLWADVTVNGCTIVPITGNVEPGDLIDGCGESVVVIYEPENKIIWRN